MEYGVGQNPVAAAAFTASGVAATGLTVKVDLIRANGTKVVDNADAVSIGNGFWAYAGYTAVEADMGVFYFLFRVTAGTSDKPQERGRLDIVPWLDATGNLKFAANALTATAVSDPAVTKIAAGVPAAPTASAIVTALFAAAMTESYSAAGATKTLPQALYEAISLLAEKAASGTTLTTKRVDGVTTAMTFTLNNATNPTSITRAS